MESIRLKCEVAAAAASHTAKSFVSLKVIYTFALQMQQYNFYYSLFSFIYVGMYTIYVHHHQQCVGPLRAVCTFRQYVHLLHDLLLLFEKCSNRSRHSLYKRESHRLFDFEFAITHLSILFIAICSSACVWLVCSGSSARCQCRLHLNWWSVFISFPSPRRYISNGDFLSICLVAALFLQTLPWVPFDH